MYIAPEPGLTNPAPAFRNLRLHLRRFFSVMALLLVCFNALQANEVITPSAKHVPISEIHSGKLTPGVPDLTNPNTKIWIYKDSSKADGTNDLIRFHLADSDGNPVAFYSVTYIFSGNGSIILPATTDAAGNGEIQAGSSVVGQQTVTVRVNGVLFGVPLIITFVAYQPDVAVATTFMEPWVDNQDADGVATNCVKVHITDANGNPVPNEDVSLTMTGSANPPGTQVHKTGGDGTFIACYTSLVAGSINITASVGGSPVKSSQGGTVVKLTFKPGAPDPVKSTFFVVTDNKVADGVQQDMVMAFISDANGNPIANQDVVFTIESGTASPLTQTIKTDAGGSAKAYYVSTVANEATVKALAGGVSLNPATVKIHFIAGVADPSKTTMVVRKNPALADGIETDCVTVTVYDQFGNPVQGAYVQFKRPDLAINFIGTNILTTNALGQADICMTSTKAGNFAISADVNFTPLTNGASPQTVTFTAGAPDLSNPLTNFTYVDNQAYADNVDYTRVVATIVDAYGNRVPNVNVTITIVSGTATPVTQTIKTDAAGQAYLSHYSLTPGDVLLNAFLGGPAGTLINAVPVKVTFIKPSADVNAAGTYIEVLDDGKAVADGVETNCVRVFLVDSKGLPVINTQVLFANTGTATPATAPPYITDATGSIQLCYTSTKAGTVTIVATVDGKTIKTKGGAPSVDVIFTAGAPDPLNPASIFTIVKTASKADNTDKNKVEATLVDKYGNPVAGVDVTFTIITGTVTQPLTVTVKTGADGKASYEYTSTVAGTVTVNATYGSAIVVNPGTLPMTFVADNPSTGNPATVINFIPPGTATADGVATNCVVVHLADANGNSVAGKEVVITFTGDATPSTSAPYITDASGNVNVCYTSTKAGTVTVSATVDGNVIENPSGGNSVDVIFTAGAPDPSNPGSTFTIVKTASKADNVDKNKVEATLADANGNPVAGVDVTFTIVTGTVTQPVTVTVKTGADGKASYEYTSTVAGTVTVNATYGAAVMVSPGTLPMTFVADNPSTGVPGTSINFIPPGTAAADGIATNCVFVHLEDINGNSVAGKEIVITYTGDATPSSVAPYLTDAGGNVIICYTSTKAGTVNVSATVDGNVIKNPSGGTSVDVVFTAGNPDPSNPASVFTIVKTGSKADNTDKDKVEATIVDANGNPVAGLDVTFTIVTGTVNEPVTVVVKTGADGKASYEYTSSVAGTVTVNATYGAAVLVNPGILPMTFIADNPSTGVPGTSISFIPPGTAAADGVATNCIVVHLADANGNSVAGKEVVISFTGNATPSSAAPYITDAAGNVNVCYTSTKVGTVTVSATVDGNVINNPSGGNSVDIIFTAGTADPSNPGTIFTIVKTGSKADNTDKNKVEATLVDANGNPVAGVDVTFTIVTGTVSEPVTVTVKTGADGKASYEYTSTVAGTVTVNATYGASLVINPGTLPMTFTADNPSPGTPGSYLDYVGDNSAAADGSDKNIVLAHITDANGNPVAGVDVVFTLTGVITGTRTQKTDALGNATLAMQTTAAGEVVITATVNGSAIVKNSPLKVYFLVGEPDVDNKLTRLQVTKGISAADDADLNKIVAHVHDAFDNPVPGKTVTITIATGVATAVTLTGTTDAKGEVTFELHSATAGEVTVTAVIEGTLAIKNGSPAKVLFTKDPDVTNPLTYIMTVSDNAIADGIVTNSVMAHVVDAAGNPLADKDVKFFITDGDKSAVINIPIVTTDVNGEATVLITSKKPGFVFIMAVVNGDTIRFGSPAKVRFIAEDVYVPKVFTPNGDGTNDVLKPIIVGTYNFLYFNVYNRWGNLVFTTRDANAGWDGRLKGVLQPNETYLWIVGGTDKDGKKVQKKGMTSLVR